MYSVQQGQKRRGSWTGVVLCNAVFIQHYLDQEHTRYYIWEDGLGHVLQYEILWPHRDSLFLSQICPQRVQNCDSGAQAPAAPLPAPSTAAGATPNSLQA